MQSFKHRCVQITLTFILVLSFSTNVFSINNSSFTDLELLEASPFDSDNQAQTLENVLDLFNRNFDESIPLPQVLVSEEISLDETEIIEALESQGMPGWALERGINMYLVSLNIIVLGRDKKLHNLAHEYAHYVQVKYQNRLEFTDEHEFEAVRIQNNFRD